MMSSTTAASFYRGNLSDWNLVLSQKWNIMNFLINWVFDFKLFTQPHFMTRDTNINRIERLNVSFLVFFFQVMVALGNSEGVFIIVYQFRTSSEFDLNLEVEKN